MSTTGTRLQQFNADRLPVDDIDELADYIGLLLNRQLTGQFGPDAYRRDNNTRASWAADALIAYKPKNSADEFETTITDLVTDLRHLCDALGVPWDTVEDRAQRHYHAETTGDM